MLNKDEIEKYNRNLIRWVKNHYWDSLEKEKDLILRHLHTFTGDLTEADIDLFAKLTKAEAELVEIKRTYPDKWFRKGQESIKRKNKSGCCCIITDNNDVESVCGAHQEWLEVKLEKAELIAEDLSAKLEKAEVELTGLKKIIAAANSTASIMKAHYGGYII